MPETKNPLTVAGVLQQLEGVLAPKPEPTAHWPRNQRGFPRRFVMLDPDTGAMIVGEVHSAALESMRDIPAMDRWNYGAADPFAGERGHVQQRLTLDLRSMWRGPDQDDYVRRAFAMARDLAAQL